MKKIKLKSNYFDFISTLLVLCVMLLILMSPLKYSKGTTEGIKLFFTAVFPGLFPFMILTKLLTEMGFIVKICTKMDKISYKLFGTSGISLYAFFMSIVSGYPIGAKIISDLYKKNLISEKEAKKMSVFCTTSGPIFVIGSVGTVMFGDIKIGIILYASHILSSLFLGILFNLFDKNKCKLPEKNCNIIVEKPKNIVNICVIETINSLFIVGAYITIFYLIGELLDSLYFFKAINSLLNPILAKFGLPSTYNMGILYGILEVTRGAKTLSSTISPVSIILTSGIISFSGLSIVFQSMAFLSEAKIKTHKFIFTKFVHFIFSMILCALLISVFY